MATMDGRVRGGRTATRLMWVAVCLEALLAIGHLGGFATAAYAARHDPAMADLTAAMQAHRARVLGFEPSILDFREYFSVCYALLIGLLAVLHALLLRRCAADVGLLRDVAAVSACGMAALAGLSLWFSVVQGLISAGLIALALAIAAIASRVPDGE